MDAPKKQLRITEPGTYDVMIMDPRWEALEPKDGDSNRMVCILPGHTEDGHVIEARLMFTRTIISGGQNKGQPIWRVSAEKLHELGLPRPFNPADLAKLQDVTCDYVVEMSEYEGKTRAEVKFINTKRREALQADKASTIWANLTAGDAGTKAAPAAEPIKPAPAKAGKEDDLPW